MIDIKATIKDMCDASALDLFEIQQQLNHTSAPALVTNSSSAEDVLWVLSQWFAQELFLDCPRRLFNTATDFVDVTQYQDPTRNLTGHEFAQRLLAYFDQTIPAVRQLSASFESYQHYFRFPSIQAVNKDSVTLLIRVPVNLIRGERYHEVESRVPQWLANFYGDSQWGAYTIGLNSSSKALSDPQYIPYSIVRDPSQDDFIRQDSSETSSKLVAYTVHVKLSFLMSLYQLIGESTNTGDLVSTGLLSTLSPEIFDLVRVDESVPYPAQHLVAQADFCRSKTDCACTYFVVFRSIRTSHSMPLTTPAHNLYVNRFQEPNCLCYISRAIPLGTDSILNPFGLCFDQNCLNPAVQLETPVACKEDQCDSVRQTMAGPNWQNNFINAGAVNIDQIERTCGTKVAPLSSSTDRWRADPLLIAGAVGLVLGVPLYLGVQAIQQKQYVFSGWHLVFLLATWTVAGLGLYALAGRYQCGTDVAQLDTQARCVDRLTGLLPLSRACCDTKDLVFCQCDPAAWGQKVCRSALATSFCKCQSNGICIPTSGDSDVISPTPKLAYRFNYQIVFACLGIYAVVAPLTTLGLSPLLTKFDVLSAPIHISAKGAVALILLLLIVALPTILAYLYVPEHALVINVNEQNKVCSVDPT